jgi:hypothetical protein
MIIFNKSPLHITGSGYGYLCMFLFVISVADSGCFSWIPDPDFYPSRIPDLGSRNLKTAPEEEGEKFVGSYHFFVATNIIKL